MRFPPEFLQELRSRCDITETIARYVDIHNPGSSQPKCLCPFHSEKTPSFTIFTQTQSYYCFGCSSGGDVIRFIMNIERLDYVEAVTLLAERAGLALPRQEADDAAYVQRRKWLAANREAARFYHAVLSSPEGKAGADYFAGRKLTKDTITRFGLGYAPDKWDALVRHMRKLGYTDAELVMFGLAVNTKNGGVIDNFRNRVMFPIIDLRGNVLAFTGRVLDPSAPRKYMNTNTNVVYKKGEVIFGLNLAKNANDGKLILVEGNMDVISMHQAGFTNTVASMGTAFTPMQISLISRYCKELYLCFDSDEAGKKATDRTIAQFASSPVKLRVVRMTGGKDADEILKTHGAEYMRKLLSGASNDTEFGLAVLREKYGTDTEDGKLNYLRESVGLLAKLGSSIERDIYVKKVAAETGVDARAIENEMKKRLSGMKKREDNAKFTAALDALIGNASLSPNPQVKQYPNAVRAEETLLATLLKSPDFLARLGNSLSEQTFVTDAGKKLFTDIASRIRDGRPLELYEFSGGSDDLEVSYLSYLLARSANVTNSLSECDECINRLVYEKNKSPRISTSGMSDEEFLRAFEDAVKKKKTEDK